MNYVKERSLSSFGQDGLVLVKSSIDLSRDIDYLVLQLLSDLQVLVDEGSVLHDSRIAAHIRYGFLFGWPYLVQLGLQKGGVGQVFHLHLLAGDLVNIGKADPSVGGTDLLCPGFLTESVQLDVIGHDNAGLGVDAQVQLQSLCLQGFNLAP